LTAALTFCAAASAGTFPLHLAIRWGSTDPVPCPSGYPSATECHPRSGGPAAVPGFGFVSEAYLAPVDLAPSACPSGDQQILGYPARLVVKGRGEISLSVAASSQCAQPGTDLLNVSQSFQITGGTGAFAGASGSGVVSRSGTGFGVHGFGIDHWDGTITAPAWDAIDLTPPRIRGATKKVLHASPTGHRVRVLYRVTATDAVDGKVPVRCKPKSGTRFKVGRTRVRCTATDLSANRAHATFLVTVRRR
jgi:HYR domain-containing protein